MGDLYDLTGAISPKAATPYLRAKGWDLVRQGVAGNRWQLQTASRRRNVAVPHEDLDRDDQRQMFVAILEVLSEVEQRPPAAIAQELTNALFDVVEFRLVASMLTEGRIPLHAAPELISGAVDAMKAAARTAVKPQAHYSGQLPTSVSRFVNEAVLAGTDKGSVVLRIRAPAVEDSRQTQIDNAPPMESFARQAVTRLVEGVCAAKAATHWDFAALDPDGLDKGIDCGLSANLCDALGHLAGVEAGLGASIGVTVHWALLDLQARPVSRVDISESEIVQLDHVASLLKEIEPVPNLRIAGPVIGLKADPATEQWTIEIHADVEDRVRRVRVHVAESDYLRAARVIVEGREIEATGTLERAGTIRELVAVTHMAPI